MTFFDFIIKANVFRSADSVTGHISINGQTRDEDYLKKMSCYIMQEDLLQPWLTVQEAMQFAVDLKLDNISQKAKSIAVSILRVGNTIA